MFDRVGHHRQIDSPRDIRIAALTEPVMQQEDDDEYGRVKFRGRGVYIRSRYV